MMNLTPDNSWTCPVHKDLKCRIFPRTRLELDKHLAAAAQRRGTCLHGFVDQDACTVCRQTKNKRRTGKGRRYDAHGITHKVGLRAGRPNKHG